MTEKELKPPPPPQPPPPKITIVEDDIIIEEELDIEEAVRELVNKLIKQNNLEPSQVISVIFSVTNDLNACFPAAIARKQNGWEKVALLDCQQMFV